MNRHFFPKNDINVDLRVTSDQWISLGMRLVRCSGVQLS